MGVRRREAAPPRLGPKDDHNGGYWAHVAHDPEHRLVIGVVPGSRSIEDAGAIDGGVKRRVAEDLSLPRTSDEHLASESAIERAFGVPVSAPSGPGRPRIVPKRALPEGPTYATAHEHRQGQRVVSVDRRLIFGTPTTPAAAPERPEVNAGVEVHS